MKPVLYHGVPWLHATNCKSTCPCSNLMLPDQQKVDKNDKKGHEEREHRITRKAVELTAQKL